MIRRPRLRGRPNRLKVSVMTVSASQVKALRERTGAGMMECKKALVETGGDMDAAIEMMRKSGLAKADKKAGRVAAEGAIVIREAAGDRRAALVEVNCETDFVAGGDDFKSFSSNVAELVLAEQPKDQAALAELPMAGGESVEATRRNLVAKIGENITVRRFATVSGGSVLASYLHGARIGVAVALEGGSAELARDVAMHIAASNPRYLDENSVDQAELAKERDILTSQAQDSGKPAEIIGKMVEGRLRKFLAEITLVGQPFVKDPDITVGKLLGKAGAKVVDYQRYEVGEGVEKKEENFADEVMAQVRGA